MIRWKNFLSTGNSFTTIQLDKSPNTLIVGENGAGKSTLLDAIHFVLFGKPFRKIKKDQLVNSINLRDCVVEIDFDTNGSSYKIVRGIKPNIFEIYRDDQLINQDAAARDYQEILERTILKMNSKTFAQMVLCSSSYTPFMQVTPNIRREIIEDLLDIRVFSVMNAILKSRMQTLRETMAVNDKAIEGEKKLLKERKEREEAEKQNKEELINSYKQKITELEISIFSNKVVNKQREQAVAELNQKLVDENALKAKLNSLVEMGAKIDTRLNNLQKKMDFFDANDTCPTCKQDIDAEFKEHTIEQCLSNIEKTTKGKNELTEKLNDLRAELDAYTDVHQQLAQFNRSILQTEALNLSYERELNSWKDMIKAVDVNFTKTQVFTQTIDIEALEKEKEANINLKNMYEIASVILRDTGIKAKIIKQYIPVINTLVNKYLASMDFFVKFELDENFNESIKSRHRDDFSYDSFSAGEKMRIDLALLFTWRTIARMKNSAATNLLILDEFFDASLDSTGCDEFLKLIQQLENANVFVISHKSEILADKFKSMIKFEKQNNFSCICKIPV